MISYYLTDFYVNDDSHIDFFLKSIVPDFSNAKSVALYALVDLLLIGLKI